MATTAMHIPKGFEDRMASASHESPSAPQTPNQRRRNSRWNRGENENAAGAKTFRRKDGNTDRFGNPIFSRPRRPLIIKDHERQVGMDGTAKGQRGNFNAASNRGNQQFQVRTQFAQAPKGVAGNHSAGPLTRDGNHHRAPQSPQLPVPLHQNINNNKSNIAKNPKDHSRRKAKRNQRKHIGMASYADLGRYVPPHRRHAAILAASNESKAPTITKVASPAPEHNAASLSKPAAIMEANQQHAKADQTHVTVEPNDVGKETVAVSDSVHPSTASKSLTQLPGLVAQGSIKQPEISPAASKEATNQESFTPSHDNKSSLAPTQQDTTNPTSPEEGPALKHDLSEVKPLVTNKSPTSSGGPKYILQRASPLPDSPSPPVRTTFTSRKDDKPNHSKRKRNQWPKKGDVTVKWAGNTCYPDKPQREDYKWSGSQTGDDEADPDHDVRQLVDWEGKWLPGPIDWEDRPGFQGRSLESSIKKYIAEFEIPDKAVNTDDPAFLGANADIALRSWIPTSVDSLTPLSWWENHITCALSEYEPGAKPWWERFQAEDSDFIIPLIAPDAVLDPSDREYGRARDSKRCSAALARAQKKAKAKAKSKEPTAARAMPLLIIPFDKSCYEITPPGPIKPKVNILLRDAYPHDLRQITDIYNFHVKETVHVPEMQERNLEQMRGRFEDVRAADLPYLVAVQRSSQKSDRRNFPGQDKVIGFAFADDYNDPKGMYRYTAELEVYVHKDYFNKGVGHCLMDRMIHLLDPLYTARSGYRFINNGPKHEAGGVRVAGSVICHVPYETVSQDRIAWVSAWLEQYDFKQVGDIPEIGIKLGKHVNLAIYHRKTGSNINPLNAR